MKLLKLIRATEWWEYKFPPILAVAYLIIGRTSSPLLEVIPSFLFVVLSLIIGAVYVSVINDITDIHEDRMAGKQNRVAGYSKAAQIGFVVIVLMIAAVFGWYMRNDITSLILYVSCYVSFTLYSLKPFRLKERGCAGIFADAAGSQLFPTLYTFAIVSSHLEYRSNISEIMPVAVWSLCFGLRGILWHQFHDLENDKRSGLITWGQKLNNREIKVLGSIIILVELCALLLLLADFGQYPCFISLFIYFIYLWLRNKKMGVEIVLMKYTRAYYSIFMNEYYQVFLPLTILATLSVNSPQFLCLLAAHVLIFPIGFYNVLKSIFNREIFSAKRH